MKSERPSKDDEQHCRCKVWEEKTVLQSLDFAFCAPSRKSSFLRILHSCEGARRLALLQEDSRVGRARIRKILALAERELSSLDGTCALLNVQQIKMVSREACVCAMCSRTGQGLHVCMRAYLRNLLGSAAPCWRLAHVIHWFLSGGLLGQARLARTSESQINSREQNERLERSTKSFGIPSFRLVVA